MRTRSALLLAALSTACVAIAFAQEPAATPSPDELEPAVDTSAQTPEPAPAPAQPAPAQPAPAQPETPEPAQRSTQRGRAVDRLELDTTQITGNRELPKVLYIVPWKRSDLGDLVGKPVNSLLDEVLTPVDRDVFKRENRYYRALTPDSATPPPPGQPASGAAPAPSGEAGAASGDQPARSAGDEPQRSGDEPQRSGDER